MTKPCFHKKKKKNPRRATKPWAKPRFARCSALAIQASKHKALKHLRLKLVIGVGDCESQRAAWTTAGRTRAGEPGRNRARKGRTARWWFRRSARVWRRCRTTRSLSRCGDRASVPTKKTSCPPTTDPRQKTTRIFRTKKRKRKNAYASARFGSRPRGNGKSFSRARLRRERRETRGTRRSRFPAPSGRELRGRECAPVRARGPVARIVARGPIASRTGRIERRTRNRFSSRG